MNPAQSEARARAELTGQPRPDWFKIACAGVAIGGLLGLASLTWRPVGSTGHTATIGGHPVPVLHCSEDDAVVLEPSGVICVHHEGNVLEP